MFNALSILAVTAFLTCLLETPIVWGFLRKDKCKDLMLNCVLINLITNLTLNSTVYLLVYAGIRPEVFILIAELIIPVIEAYMYRYCYSHISIKKFLLMAYIANAVSFFIGLLRF